MLTRFVAGTQGKRSGMSSGRCPVTQWWRFYAPSVIAMDISHLLSVDAVEKILAETSRRMMPTRRLSLRTARHEVVDCAVQGERECLRQRLHQIPGERAL